MRICEKKQVRIFFAFRTNENAKKDALRTRRDTIAFFAQSRFFVLQAARVAKRLERNEWHRGAAPEHERGRAVAERLPLRECARDLRLRESHKKHLRSGARRAPALRRARRAKWRRRGGVKKDRREAAMRGAELYLIFIYSIFYLNILLRSGIRRSFRFVFRLFRARFFSFFCDALRARFGGGFLPVFAFCAYCKKTSAHIWQNRQKYLCEKNRKL